jgi:hypothetical protein
MPVTGSKHPKGIALTIECNADTFQPTSYLILCQVYKFTKVIRNIMSNVPS